MKRYLGFLLAAVWLSTGWASPEVYDFPIDNKFLATVVGTPPEYRAELPKKIPLKQAQHHYFRGSRGPRGPLVRSGTALLRGIAERSGAAGFSDCRYRRRLQRGKEHQHGTGLLPGRVPCRFHFLADLHELYCRGQLDRGAWSCLSGCRRYLPGHGNNLGHAEGSHRGDRLLCHRLQPRRIQRRLRHLAGRNETDLQFHEGPADQSASQSVQFYFPAGPDAGEYPRRD